MKFDNYKLIVGLGNIGTRYDNTRHNLGFIFLDILKEIRNLSDFTSDKKSNFLISKNQTFNMMKPSTYMNASGLAVLSYISKNKCKPEEILIIHDELNLKDGEIRFKEGGGSGGHNGLKSITSSIGQNYHRIRLGIGHPGEGVGDFVLAKSDLSHWKEKIKNLIESDSLA
ncbi:aminoacyl-tRNA hydrolase [Candidatus Cytomitobacter indipagum]|nr:aminoacyl-tRNA hydrolase [Candidatus Cytomitobacter indipagum]